MTILAIIAGVYCFGFVLMARAVRQAPAGYQDEHGFHEVEEMTFEAQLIDAQHPATACPARITLFTRPAQPERFAA